MTRVKRGSVLQRRHHAILKLMEGSRGAHSRLSRTAQQQVMKKMSYAHRHRGLRKRDFRALWITRINAASRSKGISYSRLMYHLRDSQILLNRKILAQMAVLDENSFEAMLDQFLKSGNNKGAAFVN
jgi:large subunit ribosomal protein L20